jgi:hypothetical protein
MELLNGFLGGSDKDSNFNNIIFLVLAFLVFSGFGEDKHHKHHRGHGNNFLDLLGGNR